MTLFVWHIKTVGLFSFRSCWASVPRTVQSCGGPAWFTHQRAAGNTTVPAAGSTERKPDFLRPDTGRGLCPLTREPFKHYSSNLRLISRLEERNSDKVMASVCMHAWSSELRFLNLKVEWLSQVYILYITDIAMEGS